MHSVQQPVWPQLPERIGALMTLRTEGASQAPFDAGNGSGGFNLGDHVGDKQEHVMQNRRQLAQFLPNPPQWLTQVHGTTVINLDEVCESVVADACIATKPGVVCAVLTADCLPVLLCDAEHGVVAAAHAGWRGLADGVLENTILKMQNAGAESKHISTWFGPAISSLHFEVGEEVRARFVQHDHEASTAFKVSRGHQDKFDADIFQLAKSRLQRIGIHQFSGGNHCTFREREKFYSYRRDGVTGRMACLIWLKR